MKQAVKNEPFITVYQPIRGWTAQLMIWNDEGFYEPWTTGIFSFKTREEAVVYAKQWAQDEEIQYRD